jgi:hypothetical protein
LENAAQDGWRRYVFGPGAGRTALILAAVLGLPFCFNGLFVDDYFQQLSVERTPGMPVSPWDLFTFAWGDPAKLTPLIEHGPYAWWALPELKFSFFRPFSCALANLDHFAFGRAFIWHHLHSLAWYVALVAVVTALFRRALGVASPIAALAAVLFALDDSHTVIVGWLANRNALAATVPALLGVLAHVRWRERGELRFLPLSLLGCAVGLAGGETALGAIAYLVAYELTAAPGSWRKRMLSLVPIAVLGVGYIALYKALGSGAWGSEIYVDPMREPGRFLSEAPPKALALLGALFLGTTADGWLIVPSMRPGLVFLGVVAVVMMGVLLRRLWSTLDEAERRGLRWLTLGAAMSLVPGLATFPLNRLLMMPSVGGSALIAMVMVRGWRAAGDRVARAGARLLLVTTVILGVPGWPATAALLHVGGDMMSRAALDTPLSDEVLAGRVFVFVAPDPPAAMYTPLVRSWNRRPVAKAWITLSFAPFAHRLTRTAADTVELEVVDGRMLETVFEQLMRSSAFPVPVGMQVRLDGAQLTVIGLDHGLPSRLRLKFDEDPEGGGYSLVKWEDNRLVHLELPAVGQSIELPRLHGLLP